MINKNSNAYFPEYAKLKLRIFKVEALTLFISAFLIQPAIAASIDTLPSGSELLLDKQSFDPIKLYEELNQQQLESNQTNKEADRLARDGARLLDQNKPKEALINLKKAWELNNNLASVGVMIITTHLKSKEYKEALDAALKLQKYQPQFPDGYLLAGVAYASMGEQDSATEAFKQVINVEPGQPSASYNLANLAMQKKDYQAARELLTTALSYHPKNLKLLLGNAKLEILENNPGAAESILKKAVEAHPKEQDPLIQLVGFYLAQREYNKAVSVAEPALISFPDNEAIVDILSKTYLNQQQPQKALGLLQNFIKKYPTSISANLNLAAVLEKTGQSKAALLQIENILKLDKQNQAARYLHVKLLIKTGNFVLAKDELNALDQSFNNDPDILGLKAEIALNENRLNDAIALLQRANQTNPTNVLNVQLAVAYFRNSQIKEAFTLLENWLNEHSSDAFTLNALADLSIENNMPDKALPLYQRAVEINPADAMLHNNIAYLLLKSGNIPKALDHAERAYQLRPDSESILDTYGSIQLANGKIDKALQLFKEASKISPNNIPINLNLARTLITNGNKSEAKTLLNKLNTVTSNQTEKHEIENLLKEIKI